MERQTKPQRTAASGSRGRTSPRRSPERSPQSQPLDREPQRREPEKKFDLRRLFSSAEIVLVGKDLGAIWRNKGTRALLMLLPVTLIVLLPLVYHGGFPGPAAGYCRHGGQPGGLRPPPPVDGRLYHVAVPHAVFVRAHCLLRDSGGPGIRGGEGGRHPGDADALLGGRKVSAPRQGDLLHAAFHGYFLVSFVAFLIVVSVADILMGAPYFFNLEWLVCVVLLMPMVALFSVLFVCWELPRVHSVGEAMQTMGYLMLPLLVLYLVQFTGVFRITVPLLLGIAVLLGVLSIVLFNVTSRQFQPERLFTTCQES